MSGKSAKAQRKALQGFKFAPITEAQAITRGGRKAQRSALDAQVNHGRRIRSLAKSRGISIDEAAKLHATSHGMIKKPKG